MTAEAVVFEGKTYCAEHLPTGVSLIDRDVKPIPAWESVTKFPSCVECGRVHTYMQVNHNSRTRSMTEGGQEIAAAAIVIGSVISTIVYGLETLFKAKDLVQSVGDQSKLTGLQKAEEQLKTAKEVLEMVKGQGS